MSFTADVTGYETEERRLDQLISGAEKRYGTYLEKLGLAIVSEARSNLQNNQNIRRGDLLASIDIIENIEGKEIVVGSLLAYASIIEDGRPEVRPVHAKVLHWVDENGNDVFSTKSKAVPASPFLLPAVINQLQDLPRIWVEEEKFIESLT